MNFALFGDLVFVGGVVVFTVLLCGLVCLLQDLLEGRH
jgi:hypothetical protein